jgi:GTP-binding protein EngB required for normal cell division
VEQTLSEPGNDKVSSLRHYTHAKQEVATVVRAAKQFFQARGLREAAERCQALVVQLAEDRFNLAVVGQFKRGKSTLMNAVIGRDLLPTGLLPLTSAITTLCYGSAERVLLRRQGWTWEQEVPLAQLADFITERGNPGNEKGLVEARVELPLPFLRRGLHFIDTPGIGSARHENTATTYAFLPRMDAVIFVTSVEAPLSEAEERFLTDIRGQVRRLFVVANKMDMLGGADREEVLAYISARVEQVVGAGYAHLFPLSARNGLAARLNHDESGLQRSGLAPFEQALATFLAEEQGRTFLVSVLGRALRLFNEAGMALTGASVGGEIETSGSALALRKTMESLRASLLAGTPLVATPNAAGSALTDEHIIDQAIAASRSPAHRPSAGPANVGTRTCPVCAAQGQALFAFFAQWQYTLASDAAAQLAFAVGGGFCPVHTWQFQEMASPQGISEGYAPLIERLAVELSSLAAHPLKQVAAPVASLLADTTTCAACRLVRVTAAEQIEQLLAGLASVEAWTDYQSPTLLCLPHLQATLARLERDAEGITERSQVIEFLLREQVRWLEELAENLRSYALKRDALRRGLLHREEVDAWRRALIQLVGDRAARGGALLADQRTV